MSTKCPWCKKLNCVPKIAYLNVETYGSSSFRLCCVHCEGALNVYLHRSVTCDDISKGNFERDSWGNTPKLRDSETVKR